MVDDWLVAFDDSLRGFWRCTLCGRAITTYWYGVWVRADHRVLAYALCFPCRDRDPQRQRLQTLLRARYQVDGIAQD
jgi:hypothetical protein